MDEIKFAKSVAKTVIFMAFAIFACRLTMGWASIALSLVGVVYAMQGKSDKFLTYYLLLPFMVMVNPVLLGTGREFYILTRFGHYLLISSAIFRWATGCSRHCTRIPIGMLFLYVGASCISSATGWFPLISYLKLINFTFFIIGLFCLAADIQTSDRALNQVRVVIMAFAVLVIIGSLLVLPFPGIAYLTSARYMLRKGADFAEINAAMSEKEGLKLFTGIVNQSQVLGPMSVCLAGWVLCDMLFSVRRFSKLHLIVLMLAPGVFYMTRSRTAVVSFAAIFFVLLFYAINKARLSGRVASILKKMFYGFAVVVVLVVCVAELRSGAMTRWLRKKDDVMGDNRGFVEAVTSSRMGKIEAALSDFERNPLMGMGFQVSEDIPYRYQMGTVGLMSASVEKGNVFLAVLSESGIVGSICFLIFLVHFYLSCSRKKHMALLTLFTGFLATNLGEATLFSPTAMGGILWIVAAIGGFAIDLVSQRRTEREMMGFRG